ncbi:MAG TPA: choice-of-anchor Q domain-containing protein [Thermoleophilaceae bacterium]|nr:choice-of-anchor Q domain-containing protein [Thermoleophilaceae bacterium]
MTRYLVLGLLVICCSAAPASAANFTVTKTADVNDGTCAPGNCSLRDAVNAANVDASADVINLPAGHYTLTGAAGDDGNVSGDLDVTHDVTVAGAGAGSTVIDGNLADRVFQVFGSTTELALSGLTVTRGSQLQGAAVHTAGRGLALDGVDITDNVGSGNTYGYGVIFGITTGNFVLSIANSTFTGNVSGGNTFGGYGIVLIDATGDLTVNVSNSRFASNRMGGDGTTGAFGEGLFRLSSNANGSVTVANSTFTANRMGGGGLNSAGYGIFEVYANASATMSVTNSTFSGNSMGGGGSGSSGNGPIYFTPGSPGTLTVSGSTFTGNTVGGDGASGLGGGIYFTPNSGASTVNIVNSTFSGNSVGGGGAGGTGLGGAIYLNPPGAATATLSINNVTVASNSAGGGGGAGQGGGLFRNSAVTAHITNSILAGNLASGAPNNCSAPLTSDGHNIENGTTCGFGTPTDQNTDPLLAPLGDFGGPTPTRPLLPGSPAIDRGAGCAVTDQRGLPRPFGPACDIGAYEYAPPVPTTGAASGLGSTSAVVAGLVSPNLRSASFEFDFGPTVSYGSKSANQAGGGLAAIPVSATLRGLKPGTTYHYRLVASGDNTAAGTDRTFTTLLPSLKRLKLSPSAFPAAPRGGSISRKTGANISYTASDPGTTTFRVLKPAAGRRQGKSCRKPSAHNRRGRKCTRYVALKGSFTHKDKAGANKLHFTGRLRRRALRPGRYRLSATPRVQGKKGKALNTSFKILP